MEPVQYLRALRQWWWVIAASVLVGVVLAVALIPGSTPEYTASQTLLQVSSSGEQGGVPTLEQMAFLVPRGDVLRAAALKLGVPPQQLAGRVTAVADPVGGTFTISAVGVNPTETAQVADAFASALISTVDDKAKEEYDDTLAEAQRQADAAQQQYDAAPTSEVAQNTNDSAQQNLQTVRSQGPATSGLESVERARAAATGSGTSRTKRAAIAAAVGLLIGTGLALLLTRFDTRLHGREAVEEAFGFPVIGEIPLMSSRQLRRGKVVVHTHPDSPPAEAYRSLRSTLLLAPRGRRPAGDRGGRPRTVAYGVSPPAQGAHTVMVVSPGVGEGKSSCVANLAAAFAESGKRVLVLSCDLRRPALDTYLGVPERTPGVSEVLADGVPTASVVCHTSIPNVQIVPSGRPVSNPGEILTHGDVLLAAARLLADVVIVDTPPVLATDDMSAMVPLVDDVVIVCRAGATGTEAARRTAERLNRVGAPIAGIVLVGAQSLPAVRGYYRAYVSKMPPAGEAPRNGATSTVVTEVHRQNGSDAPVAPESTPGELQSPPQNRP